MRPMRGIGTPIPRVGRRRFTNSPCVIALAKPTVGFGSWCAASIAVATFSTTSST